MSWKVLGGFVVGILVLLGAVFYFASPASPSGHVGPGLHDEFAKCLNSKGVKFYGAFWCPHCNAEKALFGNSMQYMNYIECSTPDGQSQLPVCTAAGISGYPTWEFSDGSKVSGELSLAELASKTNCTLN